MKKIGECRRVNETIGITFEFYCNNNLSKNLSVYCEKHINYCRIYKNFYSCYSVRKT